MKWGGLRSKTKRGGGGGIGGRRFVACQNMHGGDLICPSIAFCLICYTSDSFSDTVDLFNSDGGIWSTAQLSVARDFLAATSVQNVALFAGGRLSGPLCTLSDGVRLC
jgi:hypothetical protein